MSSGQETPLVRPGAMAPSRPYQPGGLVPIPWVAGCDTPGHPTPKRRMTRSSSLTEVAAGHPVTTGA